MSTLASLPGRHGVPALKPAPVLSARPRSPVTETVSHLPALEALTRRWPVTFPSVQVRPRIITSLVAAFNICSAPYKLNMDFTKHLLACTAAVRCLKASNSASFKKIHLQNKQVMSDGMTVCGSLDVMDPPRHMFKVWDQPSVSILKNWCKEAAGIL